LLQGAHMKVVSVVCK